MKLRAFVAQRNGMQRSESGDSCVTKRTHKIETPGGADAPSASKDALAPRQPSKAEVHAVQAGAPPEAPGHAEPSPPAVSAPVDTRATTPLDWSWMNGGAAMERETPKEDATRDLPHAHDIDPSKIPLGRSVLTKTGWVVSTAPDLRLQPR